MQSTSVLHVYRYMSILIPTCVTTDYLLEEAHDLYIADDMVACAIVLEDEEFCCQIWLSCIILSTLELWAFEHLQFLY